MDLGEAARSTFYSTLTRWMKASDIFSDFTPRRQNKSPFEKLPSDILLCIGDLLPLSSRAALAISSKWMLKKIGYAPLEDLQNPIVGDQKRQFDLLVAKDHPGWRLCQHCSCFHAVPKDPNGAAWRGGSLHRIKAYGFIGFRQPMRACLEREPDLMALYLES